ncbi:thermosome alpha subunit [Aeropyrum pernix K1]|uniref:Thermosome subunit alpha n=1 Tax=Aeropyrum pernix (strain ATCC 700893 / DSM 11879 / JCM 9820 / NBRC 100138 / K1) TaxID=272557 RepID=THSA_AERPE|nr:thermosome subunit alpha [Aeropyrum pernix]Q9YDK6.2 RecName: Full=Thermosome subunit alpha; AltName: Full=Chaperonin subunit alpha; AltName: Full=Thermosome subunit 1 [Aeropyrum pernix K1]BAA79891.2 thermosome alpha subunit [Aeropyrum pernix K1]
MAATGYPVLILKEGTQRTYGREALRANILAARVLAEMLKSSLGPRGLDKMLVDAFGDITVTNDGATIVKEMEIQHPAAKLLVEVAKAQDAEVGDGTTSVVVLAGALLEKAEKLLDENLHPTIIIEGYTKAMEEALRLVDEAAVPVEVEDDSVLRRIAETTLASKFVGTGPERDKIISMVIDAIRTVAEKRPDGGYEVDLDYVKIEKKKGGSLLDSKLVRGIVLDKEVVHPAMPKRVENAKILVLDAPLEVQKPELTTKIRVTDIEKLESFLEEETRMLRDMVEKIAATGANVVITQKGIDEVAQHFLAKKGILAVRRVKRSDIEKVAKATGAKIVTSLRDLKPEYLGYAELVEERKVGEDKMVFIEGAKNPKSVTILLRGANDMLLDEAERNIKDALHGLRNILREPKIVGGGGAVEVELALKLKEFARTVGGKQQLAIEAYAEALETIPTVLAESAGMDALEALLKLRSLHSQGYKFAGVNVLEGKIEEDMTKINVYEPVLVKKQVIKSASEAAISILKIDDVIAAAPPKKKEKKGKTGEEEEEEGGGSKFEF